MKDEKASPQGGLVGTAARGASVLIPSLFTLSPTSALLLSLLALTMRSR